MLYRRVVVALTFARMIILGIIEDQAAVREGLRTYLGAQPAFTGVLYAASHKELVAGLAGLSCKPSAKRLGLRLNTVHSHIRQVYRKLEIDCKSELVAKAQTRLT